MKFTIKLLSLGIFAGLFGCETPSPKGNPEQWKQEILKAEQDFAALAAQEGIPAAFATYAADDAVLMRNNQLIKGKEELQKSFAHSPAKSPNITLTWTPDFVDVSNSGDLGYTYGKYIYTVIDSMGVAQHDTGIFHTVWKRQADGNWRFVWD
ncbi:nuclear transport factor 2 family protein [Maribellus sp. YY47]|uniref:YybH family protein n=1 Tax=Maribellus sp. YY47 TaxID=2929486 RepID=UPI0020009857|nr:nuclear transport factor 2 family protein [Maribellus sp. YY47]MCK3682905.1 nuclear transport factor 2 family protein [Maribellus sp. YY47]